MAKIQKGQETLHPIPVLLKVWNQISIDLLGPHKEIDSYKYIVTVMDYTSKFAEAEPLKTGEAVAKFLYKLLHQYGSWNIHITDEGTESGTQLHHINLSPTNK